MRSNSVVTTERVNDETARRKVVEVLRATYHSEKQWIVDPEAHAPASDLTRTDISWFVASVRGRPAGALRVYYDPPLVEYAKYQFKMLDPNLDVEDFIRRHRVAEIGRFAVIPRYRSRFTLAAALMSAATEETLSRGYTHFVTDVFEDDPHSPYGFHTRVMGFLPVATHDVGELHCRSRRITLVLDLKAAYQRLRRQGNWVFRHLTGSWSDSLHQRLAT